MGSLSSTLQFINFLDEFSYIFCLKLTKPTKVVMLITNPF